MIPLPVFRGLLVLALLASHALAAGTFSALPADEASRLDTAFQAELQKQGGVGVAVGVILKNQVVYLKGFGLADVEKRTPVTTDTLFRWGSCSQPLTAVVALQLVEKELLDLDADVRTYVPEFPYKGFPITTRHLLSQQSGIAQMNERSNIVETELEKTLSTTFADPIAALAKFKETPLASKPGEKVAVSPYAYLLLSAVVQRAGRESFASQVQKRVAQPLGMKTLQLDFPWVEIPNRARGYRKNAEQKIIPSVLSDISWKAGGGGYVSSIADFAAFTMTLLNGGLLRAETVQQMREPQKTADGAQTTYALGQWTGKDGGNKPKFYEIGTEPKGRARLDYYPTDRSAVVVMLNYEWGDPAAFRHAVYANLQRRH